MEFKFFSMKMYVYKETKELWQLMSCIYKEFSTLLTFKILPYKWLCTVSITIFIQRTKEQVVLKFMFSFDSVVFRVYNDFFLSSVVFLTIGTNFFYTSSISRSVLSSDTPTSPSIGSGNDYTRLNELRPP